MERSSGILLSISSLPSAYGIGTIGRSAREFIDFLQAAGQRYWQLLPIGPTSYGDSPYQSFSTFAGNPYFIDLDELIADGLLKKSEVDAADWGDDPRTVDYDRLYDSRFRILSIACRRGWKRDAAEIEAFCQDNDTWLPDYTLYMALKRHFNNLSWNQWPDEAAREHDPAALERYRKTLEKDIRLFTYIQYLFFAQWKELRRYAGEHGVKLIGDLPVYVSMDSSDVWAAKQFFQMSADGTPAAVAGVPPDYFCETGQLWGNPLYDWDKMREDGYSWWIRRVDGALQMFDTIRIDHFRGFESYWSVPYGDETAMGGKWEKGPGIAFIQTLKNWFPGFSVIAEDLGILTDEVRELLRQSEFPGMKVLEFAFSADGESCYLPHRYERNCVCYTGTHDNDTLAGWLKKEPAANRALAVRYLGLNRREGYAWGIIRGGMSCVADVFIAQMQDYLGLGSECRMNTPGTLGGNWKWRMLPGEASPALAEKIYRCARLYDRAWGPGSFSAAIAKTDVN